MATPFQPEKPYAEAKGTRGRGTYVIVAVVSAVLVVMLAALAVPHVFEDESTQWLVTIGAGAAVFIAIFAYGAAKRAGNQPHER